MRKSKLMLAMLALALTFSLVIAGCGKKGSGGGGGKANPASDFSYDLTEDGQGILIKGYTGGPGKVVIPATIEDIPVVEIGNNAFDGKSMTFSLDWDSSTASTGSKANEKAGIVSISIPNTVKKIGTGAFANTAITSIVIPDSVTELAFDRTGNSFLFSGCKLLAEIRLSDNIEFIPDLFGGFVGLPALKKVNLPKNLKRICGSAFSSAGELSELVIPDTLTEIEFVVYEAWAFEREGGIKYPTNENGGGFDPARESTIYGQNEFTAFNSCGKLPIKTRQKLQELGYKGEF
jgi:hypothetical protein